VQKAMTVMVTVTSAHNAMMFCDLNYKHGPQKKTIGKPIRPGQSLTGKTRIGGAEEPSPTHSVF